MDQINEFINNINILKEHNNLVNNNEIIDSYSRWNFDKFDVNNSNDDKYNTCFDEGLFEDIKHNLLLFKKCMKHNFDYKKYNYYKVISDVINPPQISEKVELINEMLINAKKFINDNNFVTKGIKFFIKNLFSDKHVIRILCDRNIVIDVFMNMNRFYSYSASFVKYYTYGDYYTCGTYAKIGEVFNNYKPNELHQYRINYLNTVLQFKSIDDFDNNYATNFMNSLSNILNNNNIDHTIHIGHFNIENVDTYCSIDIENNLLLLVPYIRINNEIWILFFHKSYKYFTKYKFEEIHNISNHKCKFDLTFMDYYKIYLKFMYGNYLYSSIKLFNNEYDCLDDSKERINLFMNSTINYKKVFDIEYNDYIIKILIFIKCDLNDNNKIKYLMSGYYVYKNDVHKYMLNNDFRFDYNKINDISLECDENELKLITEKIKNLSNNNF